MLKVRITTEKQISLTCFFLSVTCKLRTGGICESNVNYYYEYNCYTTQPFTMQ